MPYFPMYVNIEKKPCLVVGGGLIAYRKAVVLLDFGADVTVIAKSFCDEIKQLNVQFIYGEFEFSLCDGKDIVVCATDDRDLNNRIFEYCTERRIPINSVDDINNSSFIFSSYIKEHDLIASFSSSGNSPLLTQILKENCSVSPLLGELNELLGKCRKRLNKTSLSSDQKTLIYKTIYDYSIKNKEVPTIEKVEEIIDEL